MAVSWLLQGLLFPPGILLVGLVLAGVAGVLGRWRLAFVLIAAPVCATLVLALPKVADSITAPLERRALADSRSALASRAWPRTAVVLGGAIGLPGPGDRADDTGYDLNSAADRIVKAVELWQAGQVDRLVFSGGAIGTTSEAELMARFAGDLGVPRSVMLFEPDSRTTRENARYVARVLAANRLGRDIALVTSAQHLPRAMATFRCAGLDPVGVPAEFEALGAKYDFPAEWIPSAGALERSRSALKERLGAVVGGC